MLNRYTVKKPYRGFESLRLRQHKPMADPFESAPHDSGMYVRWYADLLWLFVPIQGKIAEFAATLKEYPPVTGGSLNGGLNYKAVRFRMHLTDCRAHQRHETDPVANTLVCRWTQPFAMSL